MRPQRKTPDPEATVLAVLDANPAAARVLLRHGMACVGCTMAPFETLAEAAREYRIDLNSLLSELALVPDKSRRGRRKRAHRNAKGSTRETKP
jgi:hybrid cluster-associated redox disulfide protein